MDELIDPVISAPDRESLICRTRALDPVLLWSHYVISHWHLLIYRVAYGHEFATPKIGPKYSLGLNTWWIDLTLEAILAYYKQGLK